MARERKLLGFFFVLLLLLQGSLTQARPFNILKSDRGRIGRTGFFDGLSIGAIKRYQAASIAKYNSGPRNRFLADRLNSFDGKGCKNDSVDVVEK
ncbi:hypothetical protein POTOM_028197 [Populus tomentosa]|uniref:Uncharacterized protein n=1 Tax=Populus tomentosa TaxID=118781 RepID=A0A8X7Z8K6_POPTO|nr:hypothetical protein POTOM_028197 [Populus tomentosa]